MPDEAIIFDQIVARRRSMRAFLPQPVGAETMEHLFGTAQRAPSNCNTQPWVVHVASGASLERLREALPRRFVAGEFKPDLPYDGVYEDIYKERQYGAAWALYDSVGVGRQDKPARHAQFMRNFVFFDAPHVAFLCLPEPFGLREAADLGMYAQTLMVVRAGRTRSPPG
jgi:nitroreductase